MRPLPLDRGQRRRRIARSTHVLDVTFLGADECYLVAAVAARAEPAQAAKAVYSDVCEVLASHALQVVHERLFGSVEAAGTVLEARANFERALSDVGPTYIEGSPCTGPGIAGLELFAVRPARADDRVWTVREQNRPVGRAWTREGATHVVLQNVDGLGASSDASVARPEQARQMLERARLLLESMGGRYAEVARTWIYLADILDWYADFNRVRNQAYLDLGPRFPASTGIAGRAPAGAACVMDLHAVLSGPPATFLGNARQMDAVRYGSAFSRAALWDEGSCRHLLVSGTASIDEQGATFAPGDFVAQAHRTIENVESLLCRSEMRWDDVAAATVFLKHPQDLDAYRAVAASHGIPDLPSVVVVADICRPDLLFEMEVTAART